MNGYQREVYDRIMKFSGTYENGQPKQGTYKLDEKALIMLLGEILGRIDPQNQGGRSGA